jgi:hypothetical protein
MTRVIQRSLAVAASFALVACGSDSTGPDDQGGGSSSMNATVGGTAFAPPALAIQGHFTDGVLTFAGSATSGGTTTVVTINLLGVDGPGTYELNPNFAGQFGMVTRTQGVSTVSTWTTTLSPGTGSLNLTTLTADRAAGSFQFTGQSAPGTQATGQMTVSSGTFDIRF